MTIENLVKAVAPPPAPGDPFTGTWAAVEADLGLELPVDYKAFVRLYGHGYFMEFLSIDIPQSRNPNLRLERQVRVATNFMREYDDVPHPLWPEPGGLLPFGGTDNADRLLWLTEGAPEDWKVVVWDRGGGRFEIFDCDLTDFLAGLAAGDLLPEGFPHLLPCDRMFIPYPKPPESVVRISWRIGGFGSGISGASSCLLQAAPVQFD